MVDNGTYDDNDNDNDSKETEQAGVHSHLSQKHCSCAHCTGPEAS